MAAKPGSELATNFAIATSGEPLLRGLPSPDFVFAMGQPADPAQTAKSVKDLDPLFAMLKADTKFDGEKLKRLRDAAKEWLVLFTGTRMSVHALDGSNGYVGATIIVDTTDAKRWMKLFLDMADLVDELLKAPEIEEDFRRFADAISVRSEAETVDGVDFAHWKLDIQKMEDVEPEEWKKATKVLGSDGLLVRVGAVNDNTVVLTFGGGETHVKDVIAKARAGKDTISVPSGVADVDKHLPHEKTAAAYFALDRLIRVLKDVATALGDEVNIPFEIPTVNAPIAIVGSSKEGWVRGDVFIPTKLGAAIGKAAKEIRAREESEAKAASEAEHETDDGGNDEDGGSDEDKE